MPEKNCNANCKITLYEHDHYKGGQYEVCTGQSDDILDGRWNDIVSSVRVQATGTCLFQLYQHAGRRGWQVDIRCKDSNAQYDLSALRTHSFQNDHLTGVYVRQDWKQYTGCDIYASDVNPAPTMFEFDSNSLLVIAGLLLMFGCLMALLFVQLRKCLCLRGKSRRSKGKVYDIVNQDSESDLNERQELKIMK